MIDWRRAIATAWVRVPASSFSIALRTCVRTVSGGALPKVERSASLLRAGAKSYLVYPNYDALLGYNCAHAYALAVGLLSDRLD